MLRANDKMTRVVNLRKESYSVYIGRGSIFGNPYSHLAQGLHKFQVATRDEACDKYQEYFDKRIAEDEEFRKEVLKLNGETLGCFCKPARCHGDTIIKYLEGLV